MVPAHPLLTSLLLAAGLTACRSDASPCADGAEILDPDGTKTGFVQCPDGSIDRVEVATVSVAATDTRARCAGTEEQLDCTTDSECGGAGGACVSTTTGGWDGPVETLCHCSTSCTTDSDCDDGEACVSAALFPDRLSANTCVPATCFSDADCGDLACGLSAWDDGCWWRMEQACRTPDDECRADSDCAMDEHCVAGWGSGGLDGGGAEFTCQQASCVIGRPLRIAGADRAADTVPGNAWGHRDAGPLPAPAARARLAGYWAHVAAMEHASVASFARFTLQLLALGAPPDLVAAAQAAGADEIRHARLAYGLATRFGEQAVGPGPLPLSDLDLPTDPAAVVTALVEEACVGETLGVAEAHAALARCTDPGVRAVLETVLADETRHAALAWRTLRWLLARDPALATLARTAMDRALAARCAPPPPRAAPDPGLPAWGLLSAEARTAARRHAAASLVRPLFDRTVSAPRPSPEALR